MEREEASEAIKALKREKAAEVEAVESRVAEAQAGFTITYILFQRLPVFKLWPGCNELNIHRNPRNCRLARSLVFFLFNQCFYP